MINYLFELGKAEFSVKWTGYLLPEYTGEYEVCLETDHVATLILDGNKLVSVEDDTSCSYVLMEKESKIPIIVDYEYTGKDGKIRLLWGGLDPFFRLKPVYQDFLMPPDSYFENQP